MMGLPQLVTANARLGSSQAEVDGEFPVREKPHAILCAMNRDLDTSKPMRWPQKEVWREGRVRGVTARDA